MAEYEPLIIERGRGCVLYDLDGRHTSTASAACGATSTAIAIPDRRGHPRALDRVAHVTLLGALNPATIRLAKRLVDLAPPASQHVFFSDDGATAVEVALKMAFQYWRQRERSRVRRRPAIWPWATPIMAIPWAASASAAWSDSTPCFGPCCSKPCGCRLPTHTACPRALPPAICLPITWDCWKTSFASTTAHRGPGDRALGASRGGNPRPSARLLAGSAGADASATMCC